MAIPKIQVGDVAQVIIESRVSGQRCLNVLHYQAAAVDALQEYPAAMDQLMTAVGGPSPSVVAYMLAAMGSNASVESIRAQRVDPTRSIYVAQAIGQAGSLNPTVQLPNIAGVITKQTQVAGRGRQGSFHLAGLPIEDFTNGSLTVAAVLRLEAIADQLETTITIGGNVTWVPGTWSPNAAFGQRFHELFSTFPQTTARVMRRRTVGLGI